jgi:hypothetical protein
MAAGCKGFAGKAGRQTAKEIARLHQPQFPAQLHGLFGEQRTRQDLLHHVPVLPGIEPDLGCITGGKRIALKQRHLR